MTMDHDRPELRAQARSLLYPAKRDEGVDAQGRKWIEQNTYWADGTVERVLWRENDDESWTPFSNCPKCGSPNACACRADVDQAQPPARPEQAEMAGMPRREVA